MDNTLAYIDQASFLGLRALGRGPLGQFIWIYDRAVDIDGLRRFQRNLGNGLLGRRIERSPLPFGRHRWVRSAGAADIGVAAAQRCRGDVLAWADSCAETIVDPEHGPGWQLSVQPLADGGTAVSLVVSHSIADGLGMVGAIADAVNGVTHDFGYPDPLARTRSRAVRQDIGQLVRAAPVMARAVGATVRLARRNDGAAPQRARPVRAPVAQHAERARLPGVAVIVDRQQWDERAKALGGSSNSLFAAIAARLGARRGRRGASGAVALSFPVDERSAGDTRANALTSVMVLVDPRAVTGDLAPVRSAFKRALTERAHTPNELLGPLPLTPLIPRRLARRLEGLAMGSSEQPVGCSNLGDIDPAVNRPDGTEAGCLLARLVEPRLTVGDLARMGGRLHMASGRIGERVFVTAQGYTAGGPNSASGLGEELLAVAAEFGLCPLDIIGGR